MKQWKKTIKQSIFLKFLLGVLLLDALFIGFLIIDATTMPKPIRLLATELSEGDKQLVDRLRFKDEIYWYKGSIISLKVKGMFWKKENKIDINRLTYTNFTLLHEYSHYLRKQTDYYMTPELQAEGLNEEEITDLVACGIANHLGYELKYKEIGYLKRKVQSLEEIKYLIDKHQPFLQVYKDIEENRVEEQNQVPVY